MIRTDRGVWEKAPTSRRFSDEFGVGPRLGAARLEVQMGKLSARPRFAPHQIPLRSRSPESYLDAEWAGATAPDATIDFVACGRRRRDLGADLAAAYIVVDAAHVQDLGAEYGLVIAKPIIAKPTRSMCRYGNRRRSKGSR